MKPPRVVHLDDAKAERVRRAHHEAIVEIQGKLLADPPGAGVYLGRQVFSSSGLYVPTTGTKHVVWHLLGGGGGGGGAGGGAGVAAGAGGNTGVLLMGSASSDKGITGGQVTLGAGGAAGANTGGNGGTGGDSTAVINGITYTAKGGSGGAGMTSQTGTANRLPLSQSTGSSSADASGYALGSVGIVISGSAWWSGAGGSLPPFGGGGAPVGGTVVGVNGSGYGSGGSGGAAQGASGMTGGDGASGIFIVYEWG